MLIENSEALKTWLTSLLQPLCDADPAALSKYVIALLKKEKPLEELKTLMDDQMEVFLQNNTKSFIEQLFGALESKVYLEKAPITAEALPGSSSGSSVTQTGESQAEGGGEVNEKVVPADSTTPVRASSPDKENNEDRLSRVGGGSGGERYRRTEGYERRRRSPPYAGSGPPPARRPYRRTPPPRSGPGRSAFRRSRSRSRSRSPFSSRSRRRGGGSPYRARSRSFSPPPYGGSKRRADSPRGGTPTKDEENLYLPTAIKKRPRCRDYDEKGFCLQGDQCKFDHGNDAVVLEDAPAGVPAYQPINVSSAAVYAEPYVPAPSGLPLPPLHLPPPGYQTQNRKRGFEGDSSFPPNKMSAFSRLGGGGGNFRGRGGFRGGRGGYRGGSTKAKQLAVRNIPPAVNNIAHLNNHFARFGTLVNVQVQFEGDPASALVTFSSPAEAEMAFSSSEAVLGNRFIKMFYHYEKTPQHKLPLKERIGGGETEQVKYEGDVLTKTIENSTPKTEEEKEANNQQKADEKAAAIAAIQKNQEVMETKNKLKKEAEEKRKEKLKMAADIQKNKQNLLDKLIEEQKKLIQRIEEKPEDKVKVMPLLKEITKSVEKTRTELKEALQASPHTKRNPAELQKELLDAELELFQAQQDRSDNTEEIQNKVNALRIEAARSGLLPTSRPPRGGPRGGYRGRGHMRGSPYFNPRFRGSPRGRGGRGGFAAAVTTLDRRPAKILVTGFEWEQKEEVTEHFQKFGEVVETIEDESVPSIVFQFKTRREAEVAMNGGKGFADKMLNLSWSNAIADEHTSNLESSHVDQSSPSGDGSGAAAGGGGGGVGEVEEEEEVHDDYTPLDPTYLPPGLEEENPDEDESKVAEEEDGEEILETTNDDEVNELLYNDEEEAEEEDEERSWKR